MGSASELSQREQEVLDALLENLVHKEIGSRLKQRTESSSNNFVVACYQQEAFVTLDDDSSSIFETSNVW